MTDHARRKARRARCRYCGRTYAVTKHGRMRRHVLRRALNAAPVCPGTGQPPV
jgi:ribosomal protein S14